MIDFQNDEIIASELFLSQCTQRCLRDLGLPDPGSGWGWEEEGCCESCRQWGCVPLVFLVTVTPLSPGPAVAPGQRALRALLASRRCHGVHGGHDGAHHDVHPQRRDPSGRLRVGTGL